MHKAQLRSCLFVPSRSQVKPWTYRASRALMEHSGPLPWSTNKVVPIPLFASLLSVILSFCWEDSFLNASWGLRHRHQRSTTGSRRISWGSGFVHWCACIVRHNRQTETFWRDGPNMSGQRCGKRGGMSYAVLLFGLCNGLYKVLHGIL